MGLSTIAAVTAVRTAPIEVRNISMAATAVPDHWATLQYYHCTLKLDVKSKPEKRPRKVWYEDLTELYACLCCGLHASGSGEFSCG